MGGSITGGSAAKGNDAYATRSIEVGGSFQGNITLADGTLLSLSTDNPFVTGAAIGIAMVNPGVFAENVETDVSAYFLPTGGIVYDPEAKTLTLVTE